MCESLTYALGAANGPAAGAARGGYQLRPTRSQATSLGSHSVLIDDHRRSTFACPHLGHGGAGFVDVERYSSKRSSHDGQRYS